MQNTEQKTVTVFSSTVTVTVFLEHQISRECSQMSLVR